MTRSLTAALVTLCGACSAPSPAPDAGSARPSRVVASSDGRARLWIPDGGAPADADIRIEPIDGGFTLTPSGLKFERPALLFFTLEPRGELDAGIGLLSARVQSEGGASEPAVATLAAAQGHDGPELMFGMVQVPHFSEVLFEYDPKASNLVASAYADSEVVPTFDREVGEDFYVTLLLNARAATTVSTIVTLSGAVRYSDAAMPTIGPVKTEQLAAGAYFRHDAALRCATVGAGAVTLNVFTEGHTLSYAVTGRCRQGPVVREVTKASATVSTQSDALAALIGGLPQGLLAASAPFSSAELGDALDLLTQLETPTVAEDGLLATWLLECTTDCALGSRYNGELRFSNTTSTSITGQAFVTFTYRDIVSADRPTEVPPYVYSDPAALLLLAKTDPLEAGGVVKVSFRYFCTKDGIDRIDGTFVEGAGGLFHQGRKLHPGVSSPLITCGIGGDAVMLSDNRRLTKSGTAWAVGAPGATANVIHATDAVRSAFLPINGTTQLYQGVTAFSSNPGLSPFTLASSLQTATATFSASRYALTGLQGAAVFAANDTLTATHTPTDGGAPVSVTVSAPPLADPTALFGARDGLRTNVRLPDGTFDTLFVSVVAGPPGAPPGQTGLLRTVRSAQMTLDAGVRSAPALDDQSIAVLSEVGWQVSSLYVAYYREADAGALFPGLRAPPLQAGRMVQVTPADLTP